MKTAGKGLAATVCFATRTSERFREVMTSMTHYSNWKLLCSYSRTGFCSYSRRCMFFINCHMHCIM